MAKSAPYYAADLDAARDAGADDSVVDRLHGVFGRLIEKMAVHPAVACRVSETHWSAFMMTALMRFVLVTRPDADALGYFPLLINSTQLIKDRIQAANLLYTGQPSCSGKIVDYDQRAMEHPGLLINPAVIFIVGNDTYLRPWQFHVGTTLMQHYPEAKCIYFLSGVEGLSEEYDVSVVW